MELKLLDEVKSHYPLTLIEHSSSSYSPRTYENAQKSDLTVAIAVDFHTAGERCTINAAGPKYLAVPFTWGVERAAGHIKRHVFEKKAKKLNIAGNGIYTMHSYGYDQHTINQKVYEILKRVCDEYAIEEIRSGGQTGVDIAGIVAGMALNIPTVGLFPKGWRQRFDNGFDVGRERDLLYTELVAYAENIKTNIPEVT
jgi:hypothetical protein